MDYKVGRNREIIFNISVHFYVYIYTIHAIIYKFLFVIHRNQVLNELIVRVFEPDTITV